MSKPRLTDFAAEGTGQWGETGIVRHVLAAIGERSRVCVEYGAGDGLDCSNTAQLWRHEGWTALLVESDVQRYALLQQNTEGYDVRTVRAHVTPEGPDCIAALLIRVGLDHNAVDFMSIDVDGDDWFLWDAMQIRPRIVAIEFVPTVPPHLEVRQRELGEGFGASLLAMVRLGTAKGYRFVGATYANAFFVIEDEARPFDGFETDLTVLFPPQNYTYAVSGVDGKGLMTLVGQAPPWQARGPYVLPLHCSGYVSAMTDDPAYLRTGFEQLWGPAEWFTAAGLDRAMLRAVLAEGRSLVCIDLSGGSLMADEWLAIGAEFPAYKAVRSGPVIGLVRQ